MSELRNQRRWQVFYYLRLFEREGDRLLGHAIDISPEGLRLGGDRASEAGQRFKAWMEVPQDDDRLGRLLFDVECAWCKRDEKTKLYESGFRITGLLPRAKLLIQGLIDDLELNS